MFYLPQKGGQVKITILYDNYKCVEGLQTDWGFACLIEGTEKTILFDTGTKPDILEGNIKALKLNISGIKDVFISHNHSDHTGSLARVIAGMDKPKVYMVKPVPDMLAKIVAEGKGELVQVNKEFQLCKDVHSTGLLGTQITEHSLLIDTPKGLIMITGCSHPGIVDMVKKAKEIYKKNVYYVGGGFHLMNHTKEQVKEIIDGLKALGVVKCGASHCTGDAAIKQFKEAFGNDFVELGVGRVLTFDK